MLRERLYTTRGTVLDGKHLLDFVPGRVTRRIPHVGTNDLATASRPDITSVYTTLVLPSTPNRSRGSSNWRFIGGFNSKVRDFNGTLLGLFVRVSYLAWNVHRLLTPCRRRSADVRRDHAASREHVRDPGAVTLLDLQQRPDSGFLGGHSASVTLPPSAEAPASRKDDAGPTHQPNPVFSDDHPATVTLQPSVKAPTCLEDDTGGRPAGQSSRIALPAPQARYNLRKTYSAACCSQQD
ncbi:hypothetical protein HPB47_017951 [Ixodes persulcatus]|uniref:Uncharacterized protein n=1 Tax=Ixodes persulcatus TaxID=34615 RepID=A0AC60QNY2_IXOPE|nr:hypothetical protein HPB47_017951 [Ixodes persulcatus]